MRNYLYSTTSLKVASIVGGAALLAATVGSAGASVIRMDLGTVLSGSFTAGDGSSSPYLVATVADTTYQGHSGVDLTLSCPGLGFAGSGLYEHVNAGPGQTAGPGQPQTWSPAWLFNLSSTTGISQSSFTVLATSTLPAVDKGSNGFTLPTISVGGSYADSSGPTPAGTKTDNFNLGFGFAEGGSPSTDGQGGGTEFGYGDSIEYFINGLSTTDFQPGTAGNYYSAAAIDDSGPNLWVAGTAVPGTPLPEPASLAMMGAMGLGILLLPRKKHLRA